ncbi:MAG: acetate--CoA ligase family protein [Desulfarculaceae bacterium]|nr:acetate--CoA ligase family protein [Desulfarculaceae bacterium]MCF8073440.1 acetate--CoA ligase family protein [Desulfarculaceae bacterium]MCF8100413.1 acetate--CoA ligase family protein [Desulfarculaceae bacterium]MCF8115851.1 acetate--CoA ligase family protein [Desulfarculaceae bacterium]
MKQFFYPGSVVILGVSPRPGNMGRNILKNLQNMGYAGEIYLVNPKGGELDGLPMHPSVADLPAAPELAVILTPASTVPGLMEDLGAKGCKRVVIESGGFSELESDRGGLEQRIVAAADKYGMRFIGPNCIGVICTDSKVSVPFPLLNRLILPGGLSIMAQSGGIGLTYLHASAEAKVGIAKFCSMGNKLNVNERDLLGYLIEDPQTTAILLYLESIVDGRALYDLIRSTNKPVVVHKSNIGELSHAIASSHTAALANDDAIVDAALKQAGAIRVNTVHECLQVVKGLSLPRPKGRRLAIISRSGGHAVVAADAAYRHNMELPPFPPQYLTPIQEATRASVIKLQNPLDLGDLFKFEIYVDILKGALELEDVDGVVMLHGYRGPEAEPSRKFVAKAGELCREAGKPLALALLVDPEEMLVASELSTIPLFTFAEEAIAALSASEAAGKVGPAGEVSCAGGYDIKMCKQLVGSAGPDGWLELPESLHLLNAAGIPVAPFVAALDPDDAVHAASTLGYPVVLKAVGGDDLLHKTESGGVALGLADEDQLREAAEKMTAKLKPSRLLVMNHIAGGQELILGVKRDPGFGPVVLLGLGGTAAEALGDVSLRLAPVDDQEAGQMMDQLKGARLLKGFRGKPPVNRPALLEAVMRLSILAHDIPAIAELDINPLLAGPGGVLAVDARVRVGGEDSEPAC